MARECFRQMRHRCKMEAVKHRCQRPPSCHVSPQRVVASCPGCHLPRHCQQSHQIVQDDQKEYENNGDLGMQVAKVQGGGTHKEYLSAKCKQ